MQLPHSSIEEVASISVSLVPTKLRTVFLEQRRNARSSRQQPSTSMENRVMVQPFQEPKGRSILGCRAGFASKVSTVSSSSSSALLLCSSHTRSSCQAFPCPTTKANILNSRLLLLNFTIWKLSTEKWMRIITTQALLIKTTPLALCLALKSCSAFCKSGKIICATMPLDQGVKLPNLH